jgi:hypothetical protein
LKAIDAYFWLHRVKTSLLEMLPIMEVARSIQQRDQSLEVQAISSRA